MLRITKQTDYGIVLLSLMCHHPERLFNAPELAAEAGLPLPTVSKILKLLARDGLLASHRGVKGGYSLSRQPEAISVAEVIQSLEGPIAMTECIDDGPGECVQEGSCPLQANWQVINMAVRQALEGITLLQMGGPLPTRLVQLGRRAAPGAPGAPDAQVEWPAEAAPASR
ncbi:MAG TPA: SUF system Fe-S cluster assembly regulator [Thermoanaerobaculia bacterium]|nr:SUF system Fe-S cluster assembly regulator [Thermoanaerobaculia bacterium]